MNMGKLMKQAQKKQKQMESAQSHIDKQEYEGKSPQDLVTATMTGNHQVQDVQVDSKVIEDGDLGMLNSLIVSAVNDAENQIYYSTKSSLDKYTKGIPKHN